MCKKWREYFAIFNQNLKQNYFLCKTLHLPTNSRKYLNIQWYVFRLTKLNQVIHICITYLQKYVFIYSDFYHIFRHYVSFVVCAILPMIQKSIIRPRNSLLPRLPHILVPLVKRTVIHGLQLGPNLEPIKELHLSNLPLNFCLPMYGLITCFHDSWIFYL